MNHRPLFYKNNQMTRSTKLFFASLVLALSMAGLRADGAEIFNELHDLNRTNEQLAENISKYLNSIVAGMTKSGTPLHALLGNFAHYKDTILNSKVVPEKDLVNELQQVFEKEASNLMNSDASGLEAQCAEIFRKNAILVFRQGTEFNAGDFFSKSGILKALRTAIKNISDKFNASLGKNSVITTTVTEKVQTNLQITADYKNRLGDYVKFKENPIEVLISASSKLIDGTNEKPTEVESLFDPLNDRVFEYVKATSLIGKKRDQPWVPQVLSLVEKLIVHNKRKNGAHDWNVKLIRRILGLVKESGHKPEAMDIIQEFLAESEPVVEETVVPVEPTIIEEPVISHPSKIHQDDGINDVVDIEEEQEIDEVVPEIEPTVEEPVEEEVIREEEQPEIDDIVAPEQEDDKSKTEEEVVNEDVPSKNGLVVPQINKIESEDRAENLVNVVVGELTPKQLDVMRFSPDVIEVIQEKKIEIDENGDEVEYVYVSIVRSDSPCYEDAIKQMSE